MLVMCESFWGLARKLWRKIGGNVQMPSEVSIRKSRKDRTSRGSVRLMADDSTVVGPVVRGGALERCALSKIGRNGTVAVAKRGREETTPT